VSDCNQNSTLTGDIKTSSSSLIQ